ncbi:HlyD family type I secretion periplasmic adaptor subunit [Aminobacter sp. P9b]|uniref:HlyD family type I secretion periplasmic adaptor subunit n=1 Tax=Aminobacter sp. P9b TaxID=3133697 RepID=UPI00324CB490
MSAILRLHPSNAGPMPEQADADLPGAGDGIRGNLALGAAVTSLLVGGLGAWAATTTLAGAVIAPGTVVVESNVKKVQHQEGGIVGELLAREGDRVNAGDTLIRLDETMTRANLEIVSQQHDRTVARQARLRAELLDLPEITVPENLASRVNDPDVAAILEGERALFRSRSGALAGLKSQLAARSGQLRQQIEGLAAQKKATADSAALIEKDLEKLQALYTKKLVSMERIGELQLELSRLRGDSGRLAAAVAETEGRISETTLQALQLDEELRKEVNEELRELEGKEAELAERRLVAKDQLRRMGIQAPQSGFVQELAVHTVGGVIAPGEVVMLIVPEQDRLVIDAMVAPQSIDELKPGQEVSIRLPAFDANTTPECRGTLDRVSADIVRDPQQKTSYFVARTTLDDREPCLGGLRLLQPGMPAEVHIRTADRTVWSYFMKPLFDQMSRAFKD